MTRCSSFAKNHFEWLLLSELQSQSLVSLTLHYGSSSSLAGFTQLPHLLGQTPRLIELILDSNETELDAHLLPLPHPIAELKNCTKLQITGFFSDQAAYLFDAVSFPSLSKLDCWTEARRDAKTVATRIVRVFSLAFRLH